MNDAWGWLRDAVVQLGTRLFQYIFMGKKTSDAVKDDDDKAFQDRIKKEGW
jgi:hypothetical protein